MEEAPNPSNDVELLEDAHEAARILGASAAAVRAAAYRKSIPAYGTGACSDSARRIFARR